MPQYAIVFARSARKELQDLPRILAEHILGKIDSLVANPRPSGCKKLRGHSNLWRIRVGEYRIIYSIYEDRQVIDISIIRHRSEAYR
jgi:mRNA interferase RelE/StbE